MERKISLDETMVNRLYTTAYQNIFQELRLKDKEEFRRYLRINTETYQVKLFIYLFICFDIILRIEKPLRTYLITFFVVFNIPITLMELSDFIYHQKCYIDHESTNINTTNSPYSVF